jgi:hypothetical protein
MDRLQLVSLLAAGSLLLIVLELVRRRRLLERYALLWLFAASVMVALAAWSGGLKQLAVSLGIVYAPNALFFAALAFIVVLLLHFSAAVSRLTDQSKVLAQRLAIMEERLRHLEHGVADEEDEERLAPALTTSMAETAGGRTRR